MKGYYDSILKDVIDLKVSVVNEFVDDFDDMLGTVGNPEKLINKPYDSWTPQDTQMLSQIYGAELNKFIANKAIKRMQELEKGV